MSDTTDAEARTATGAPSGCDQLKLVRTYREARREGLPIVAARMVAEAVARQAPADEIEPLV